MVRALLLALVLAGSAAAELSEAVRRVVRQFEDAYAKQDAAAMYMAASRPARTVDYALAVWALLEKGRPGIAQALADARKGPEREGLKRLLRAPRPSPQQREAWKEAVGLKGDEALQALRRIGQAPEGTILAVEVEMMRARALLQLRRQAAAASAFRRCAELAHAVGWLTRERDAWIRCLPLDRSLLAADGYVRSCEELDDRPGLPRALGARGGIRAAKGMWKEARQDYVRGSVLAHQLGDELVEGHLLGQLGYVFHRLERQPRKGLKWYRKALPILRPLSRREPLQYCLFNAAVACSDIGSYTEALAHLDELRESGPPATLLFDALAQRAYVLRRQGRLEKSAAAYGRVLEAASDAGARLRLHADMGELQLERGDLREAERHFEAALAGRPELARALAGRGAVKGAFGDIAGSRADFDAAAKCARSPGERLRILLARMAYERSWGRLADARRLARAALQDLDQLDASEYGNAALLWYVLGDFLLLDNAYEDAAKVLARASVFYQKLRESGRAVPAYARETLVLITLGDGDGAAKRLGWLKKLAGSTPGASLKSMAKCVEAMFARRGGRPQEAIVLLRAAETLARKAGDREREATALAHRALLDPEQAHELVLRALAALDSRPDAAPSAQPFLEGEHPFNAASIGVRALLDSKGEGAAGDAYPLIERIRGRRLQLALRGRDAILAATLAPDEHRSYLAARGRLREARAEKSGVEEARRGFLAVVERLRERAPLAFPVAPPLAEVQEALAEDEALLLMVHDFYAKAILAVDRTRAVLRRHDPKNPLQAVKEIVAGKRKLIVALDGILTLETTTWQGGVALDAFGIGYVASAASFLRLRRAGASRGVAALGPVPRRFAGKVGRLEGESPVRLDLRHPQASGARLGSRGAAGTVVLGETRRTSGLNVEGIGVVAAAWHRAGARHVILSLDGPAPPQILERFYANLLDGNLSAPAALREAKLWARRQPNLKDPRLWAGLVLFGVP